MTNGPLTLTPIGIARTPFTEKVLAPRQPRAEAPADGTIELLPGRGYEDALSGLEEWSHVWLVYAFHENDGWRPKVRPPRSRKKLGVFATRAPYRPNPIGLSAVELVAVDGLTLRVRGVDLLDRTPILDIKPYVAYADAIGDASDGWLAPADPGPGYDVRIAEPAASQLAWLEERGQTLHAEIERRLALGPEPHAYRRIRVESETTRCLAVEDWRVRFRVDGLTLTVESVSTGYRPRELAAPRAPHLVTHRDFARRWPS